MKKMLLMLFLGSLLAGTLSFFLGKIGFPYAKDVQHILVFALIIYFALFLKGQQHQGFQ